MKTADGQLKVKWDKGKRGGVVWAQFPYHGSVPGTPERSHWPI